jgi:hypothetical protein
VIREKQEKQEELKDLLIAFQNSIIFCIEKKFDKKLDDMKERINELGLMIEALKKEQS